MNKDEDCFDERRITSSTTGLSSTTSFRVSDSKSGCLFFIGRERERENVGAYVCVCVRFLYLGVSERRERVN